MNASVIILLGLLTLSTGKSVFQPTSEEFAAFLADFATPGAAVLPPLVFPEAEEGLDTAPSRVERSPTLEEVVQHGEHRSAFRPCKECDLTSWKRQLCHC